MQGCERCARLTFVCSAHGFAFSGSLWPGAHGFAAELTHLSNIDEHIHLNTGWCSRVERTTRLELATPCLEGRHSTN